MKTKASFNSIFIYLLVLPASVFSQAPDFFKAPSLEPGDSSNIVSLISDGVKISRQKTVCWFPKDSLSQRRMNDITDTIELGIVSAEKFIGAPKSWQVHSREMPYTFYFRRDTIISHASMAGFVSVSFWRIKEGKAPWLHEAMHEMLFAKENDWFSPAISEDFYRHNIPKWLHEGLPEYISLEVSKLSKLPWYDVFSRSSSQNVDSVFIENIKHPNGKYIIAHIGTKGVMPELLTSERQQYAPGFYHGSCSFIKFIARRYGLDLLLHSISVSGKEHDIIEASCGKSMAELKQEWLNELKIEM